MGVLGLWKILEPSAHSVDLESMQGKILSVDVSLWLHQFAHGFQDGIGPSSANGHLLGLFHRLCKLLFYRIKPVFVFDGGVPTLKRQTMAARRRLRHRAEASRQRARENLLVNYVQAKALETVTAGRGEKKSRKRKALSLPPSRSKPRDMFELPSMPSPSNVERSDDVDPEEIVLPEHLSHQNLMTVDVHSDDFKCLPLEIQHELIVAIQDEYKVNRLRIKPELPDVAGDFSSYQLQKLMKRGQLTQHLEKLRKLMASRESASTSGLEIENASSHGVTTNRILSDDQTRFVLIKESGGAFGGEDGHGEIETEPVTEGAESEGIISLVEKHGNKEAIDLDDDDDDAEEDVTTAPNESGLVDRKDDDTAVIDDDESDENDSFVEVVCEGDNDDEPLMEPSVKPVLPPSSLFPADVFQITQLADSSKPAQLERERREDSESVVTDICEVKEADRSYIEEQNSSRSDVTPIADDETVSDSSQSIPTAEEQLPVRESDEDAEIENTLAAAREWLAEERVDLVKESARQERRAAEVTNEMYSDGMELLRLFGVPYIQAPMEAEAQCAWLDFTKQTEGTITDDNDVFLFSGQTVYRNIFRQDKYAEKYVAKDIKELFGLNREKLVDLALLLGSDYTTGIQGIGHVTAMEILGLFEGKEDWLNRFRDWWHKAKESSILNTGKESGIERLMRRVHLPASFPDNAVRQAYFEPTVDESKEPFEWAMPDLEALRDYAARNFGWSKSRLDEVLLPVIQKLNSREVQPTISAYFPLARSSEKREIRSHRSKRMRQAVSRVVMSSQSDSSDSDEEEKQEKKSK